MFEFVAIEHTPKNNMLVGTRLAGKVNKEQIDEEIETIKRWYGVKQHHLYELLRRGCQEA